MLLSAECALFFYVMELDSAFAGRPAPEGLGTKVKSETFLISLC